MKVLIVHPCKGFHGGAEEVVVQLCKHLTTIGHNVILVTNNLPEQMPLVGYEIVEGRNYFGMGGEVRRYLDWADVVNVHNFPATLIAYSTKKPIVYMCNEPAELFTKWWREPIEAFNKWWVRKSGMKVVVADQMQAHRFHSIYGIQPKVIPYGIDYKFWSQGERPEGSSVLKLLQVGTITPYKNQLHSILSLVELLLRGNNATLTLVGRLGDKKYYQSLLRQIGYLQHAAHEVDGTNLELDKRVSFLGQKAPEEVRDLYHNHDVLVHPVQEQGGWLAPFEAMCAGLPVVVAPSFTASSIIRSNGIGVVTNKLHEGVKEALEGDFSPAGQWVKENLTWEKYGESMVKVFKEAVNAHIS